MKEENLQSRCFPPAEQNGDDITDPTKAYLPKSQHPEYWQRFYWFL
ncbi:MULTISPECIES: hypothetical protein [Chitinophagaceae]